jgi:polyribonucleotide nucleotidyltransferase
MSNKPQGFRSSIDLGNGKSIEIETGILAKQAHGSVVVKCGNTMILATVVSNKDAKENVDFLPLSVDYQEKFASVGRIPGSFFRREAKLSDYEVLISRIVDRALRPLFPSDYHADTQVALTLISSDQNIMPDALVGLAASAALLVSDVPFNGPISEVRVARIDGKFVVNPFKSDLERADMDLIVAGTEKDLNMVEGECQEVSEVDGKTRPVFSGDQDEDGAKKYTLGFFKEKTEADTFCQYLKLLRIKDAVVVKYENGKKQN